MISNLSETKDTNSIPTPTPKQNQNHSPKYILWEKNVLSKEIICLVEINFTTDLIIQEMVEGLVLVRDEGKHEQTNDQKLASQNEPK